MLMMLMFRLGLRAAQNATRNANKLCAYQGFVWSSPFIYFPFIRFFFFYNFLFLFFYFFLVCDYTEY